MRVISFISRKKQTVNALGAKRTFAQYLRGRILCHGSELALIRLL